ncbi:hypothetical protein SAMN05421739_10568 [Pontibacter chinhatensis]|uniref:Uncharacterized protein n=1 Tax=Pontibacter chinhatensis TaxID=1436961 RepID=A0A1I2WK22_9BACT|nr:hypothetical protein SAMN05421739_10568 [Pontibacter chinhatensis]
MEPLQSGAPYFLFFQSNPTLTPKDDKQTALLLLSVTAMRAAIV